jgi:hypothetical protein
MAAIGITAAKFATSEAVNVNTLPSRSMDGARNAVSRLSVLKVEPGLSKRKVLRLTFLSRLVSSLKPATIPLSLQATAELSMRGVEFENAFPSQGPFIQYAAPFVGY